MNPDTTEWQQIQPLLRHNEPVGKFTAARMGGIADYLYVTSHDDTQELERVFLATCAENIPIRVIGGGANVLVSDKGVRGLLIVNRSGRVQQEGDILRVGAGVGLLALARYCLQHNLTGFEWAVGVPGTVGGAIVNNAGAHGSDMSQSVQSATVLFGDGTRTIFDHTSLQFQYRSSSLKHKARPFLVLDSVLQFSYAETESIKHHMEEFNAYRKRTQPSGASLGSVFKNPPNDYAGRLIEASGLKGFAIGTAQVSPVHANFFLNTGDTKAQDYRALIETVQQKVFEQFGVALETEIQFLGEWGV